MRRRLLIFVTLAVLAAAAAFAAVSGASFTTASSTAVRAATAPLSGDALRANAGDGQVAAAGAAVATAPSVKVTDAGGNPVSGVIVTFAVASGGGSAAGTTQTTDSSGVATIGRWTLGPAAGANTLTATAAGVGGSVTFTATGTAGAASKFVVTATTYTPSAGSKVSISAQLADGNGDPVSVSGVTVAWGVTGSGGSLSPTSSTTDSSGVATTILSTAAGSATTYTVSAASQSPAAAGASPALVSYVAVTRDYAVGDVGPDGGYIFYVNPNYQTDGWRYLEAAPADQSSGAKWADNTTTSTGATGTAVGTGLTNTSKVTGSSSPVNSAIEYAQTYSVAGVDDWFLPSQGELSLMYTSLYQRGLGGFIASSYWSSTETSATSARRQSFSSGTVSTATKSTSYRVRAVRRFSTTPTYSLTYLGNGSTGGSPPVDAQAYTPGTAVTVLGQASLRRDGYSFRGWNTAADGSGAGYAAGSSLTMLNADLTLYAQWHKPSYTIAILPDTQSYVAWKPAEMASQIDWLAGNKDSLGLQFVAHVGDLVQNWTDSPSQWSFMQSQMTRLTAAGIPFSTLPGNHDYANGTRDSSVYNTYFPLSGFSQMPTYGGSYDGASDNTYHIVRVDTDGDGVADDEVLVLSLEIGPRAGVVAWADSVLRTHPRTNAILVTHAYLDPSGNLLSAGMPHAASNGYGLGDDVYDGDRLWSDLVYPNNNVRFVISGHDGTSTDGSALRVSSHADSSPVYQIMANYERYPVGDAGYLLLLSFTDEQVAFKTFSPWTDTYKTDSESQQTWSWTPTTPGVARTISLGAGDAQTAVAGTAVPTRPAVVVTDNDGDPVAGCSVTFEVASGGGGVSSSVVTTDSSGIAATDWTLGKKAGANTLTATAAGLTGSPVTFTATGTAGPAAKVTVNAGTGQTATVNNAVATDPSVLVTDANDNPVQGATVTFAVASGGGSVTGATQATGVSGIATVSSWSLGTAAGANTLTATVSGLTAAAFTATGTADIPATVTVTSSNYKPLANTAVTITALVIDRWGNPVPTGTSVSFSKGTGSSSGGAFSPSSAPTNSSGIATTQFTVSSKNRVYYIKATAGTVSDTSDKITAN